MGPWGAMSSERIMAAKSRRIGVRPRRYFLHLQLEWEDAVPGCLTVDQARHLIHTGVRHLVGAVGEALVQVELLRFDADSDSMIVAAPVESVVALRAALTLLSSYEGRRLRINIVSSSAHLLALAYCSRQFHVHSEPADGFTI
ncbi:Uncharacterized protein PBTT_03440 [Plasmodiophora brassicae]|uniref:Uncharacterized protein n=1 Tax=Plasmodiophora brassicae TaxID=37360 RepID=A0A0G4IIZ0_PLABS|nr:hypothetical protein PBRA_003972 [Plasmodiophora brassicae]SPQ96345.1 unnamed protein product [Plasmodiophora brassicae]